MPIDLYDSKLGSKPVRVIRVGQVCLADVPLGREFAVDGRLYQSLVSPGTYGEVLADGRFRYGDEWFIRLRDSAKAQVLEPNMPFGNPQSHGKDFDLSEKVSVLEVVDRGAAQT